MSLLFVFCSVQAQRELKNPLIDSKVIINKGVSLYHEGKYKELLPNNAHNMDLQSLDATGDYLLKDSKQILKGY